MLVHVIAFTAQVNAVPCQAWSYAWQNEPVQEACTGRHHTPCSADTSCAHVAACIALYVSLAG